LSYNIPADAGDRIKRGMTEEEIRRVMDAYGRHQFSVIYSNQQVRCVEYIPLNLHRGYYFVFTNTILLLSVSLPVLSLEILEMFMTKKGNIFTLKENVRTLKNIFAIRLTPEIYCFGRISRG